MNDKHFTNNKAQQIKIAFYNQVGNLTKNLTQLLLFLGRNGYHLLILPFLVTIWFFFFNKYIDELTFKKNEVLTLIISISSITVAILITYLFNKVFSEKSTRIEYKKIVDKHSVNINHLRQLLFRIRNADQLWNNVNHTIKTKYANLTLEIYRGEDKKNKLTYDEFQLIDSDISGLLGQAYLAMKGFADGDESFLDYSEINARNYTLSDINRYEEYQSYIWSFLDEYSSNNTVFDPSQIQEYWYNSIAHCYKRITGNPLVRATFKEQIRDLMTFFNEKVFPIHYYYNKLLDNQFPKSFVEILVNILVNVIVVIISLILFVAEVKHVHIYGYFILSVFITNIIDIIKILYFGIRRELSIEERYSM